MATNGNDPRLDQLEQHLRGANPAALQPAVRDADGGGVAAETYDLAAHMSDVVAQLREIARYTSDYADNLQKGLVIYEHSIQQKLGKITK